MTYKLLEDPIYKEKIKMRIFKKCKKDTKSDCILWTGGTHVSGYGCIHLKETCPVVHRVLYEILVKPIPVGKIIMHTCDNKKCLNIDHLRLATIKENNKDRSNKGRTARLYGEENSNSKLNRKQVEEIRQFLKDR
jgi:hypothetical protein